MKWITATDLQHWAATLPARAMFPELIADLIRATAREIQSFRFPSGDKAQIRGFDGWLNASGEPPYVPDGLSVWEFGASGATAAKATKDFEKRTGEVSSEQQKQTILVLASPYTWDDPQNKLPDWIAERKKQSDWKDILYLDGVQIEDWLQQCAAVSARYAAEMQLRPVEGVQSANEFWDEFRFRFKVPLTEEVLLCGRESQANNLLQELLQGEGPIKLAADAPDEVIAFAIAAIRKAENNTRLFLESRVVVVDTQHAARMFTRDRSRREIFFPRLQANEISGLLSTIGPTLIALGRDQSNSPGLFLQRPSTLEFSKALHSSGISEEQAESLARNCGRSIVVLARQFPPGHATAPAWVEQGKNLLPALLAGGWDGASEADCDILSSLTEDRDYPKLESLLRRVARFQDPPIDNERSIWKIRAPVDAFVHLAHLVGRGDLDRLGTAARIVFSEVVVPINPDAPYGQSNSSPRRHSSWLRDGIANTLLQISVLSTESGLNVPGVNPQTWVEDLISSLPGLASDHRLIASLKGELWMLMEAAPRPLLSALEHLLEGDGVKARGLFSADGDFFAPTSPHTYVLWALETIAWDPRFLERVLKILAKLASVDPGGNTSNRPINSLRSIVLPWSPNTHATLRQRRHAIDRTLNAVPGIAWDFLLSLLPRSHDVTSPTRKPKFREAGASQQEMLTYARVWEAQDFVIERVFEHVQGNAQRWVQLVETIPDWSTEQRARAFSTIDSVLSAADRPNFEIWSALNDLLNKHLEFADAEWALRRDELATLQSMVRRHQPPDVVERVAWLFRDWSVQVGASFDENDSELKKLRGRALTEVMTTDYPRELFRLVDAVSCPEAVAASVADMELGLVQVSLLVRDALRHGSTASLSFARVLSAGGHRAFGKEWEEQIEASAKEARWDNETVATLLLNWADNEEVWNYVSTLPSEVRRLYWTRKYPLAIQTTAPGNIKAIQNYISVSRPAAALQASHRILSSVPSEMLLSILSQLLQGTGSHELGKMTGYYVEHVFDELYKRDDIALADIAKLEYAFLPIIDRRPRKLVLHSHMAQSPEFYVSLITSLFRPASQEDKPQKEDVASSDRAREKWRNDYRLLSEFHSLPGLEGEILNYETLRVWVSEVRRLGAEADRAVITDIYVGHLLAHAPEDSDGGWPDRCVRKLIDELVSADIERGIMTERFNMRGVYGKALYEGGKQEREIAQKYRSWAGIAREYPVTSMMLERIAESYEHDAVREDEQAVLDKLRDA